MASSDLSLILNTANANLYPSDSSLPSHSFSAMHPINHLSDTSFCGNTNNSFAGSWEQINPQLWSRQNILEWIAYHVEESKYDAMLLNLNCCNIDGPTLCSCSRDAMMCTFGPQLGNTLYQSLENLKHRHSFDIQNYISNDIPIETYELLNDFLTDYAGPSLDTVIVTDNRTDKKESYFNEYKTQLTPVSDNGYESYPESLQSSITGGFLSPSSPESTSSDSDLENTEACYFPPIKNLKQEPVEKKKRGRPPKMSHGSEHYIENKKNKHAPRGTHLWEFIRDILIHPEKNQGLMKWEDRKDGIFKFLKSEAVAQLWGQKKKNSSMTYEKLSRAMRYYYKREILERVDGRRLVYKFGKNANGWKLEEIGM